MGMYTAIRGKVIIKEKYRELVELINEGDWDTAVVKFPFVNSFVAIERGTNIPKTKETIAWQLEKDGEIYLDHDPQNWSTDAEYFTDLKGLEWTFIASLKNYADRLRGGQTPIGAFIENILSEVTDKIILIQESYEEWIYNDVPYVEYEFDNVVVNLIRVKE